MATNEKKIGIQDVAREAGVSKTSVSNYLNGRNQRLSETTLARIRETVERLNYNPSLGARRLSSQTASRTIAAVIRHDLGYAFQSPFFPLVMKGIGEVCDQLGYRILLIGSMARPVRDDIDYALSLARGIVDGFLLFELEEDDPYVRAFERSKVPYLCFGRPEEDGNTRWVASDQEGGIVAATEHLWEHGHRKIALFPGQMKLMVTKLRVAGFKKAIASLGGVWDEALVQYDYASGADAFPVFARLLAEKDGPTAYIIPQVQAASFHRACREARGVAHRSGQAPFEGEPALVLADYFPPEVSADLADRRYTYVRGHVHQVGVRGAARLLDQIRGVRNDTSELFPTELVIGESCGCGGPAGAAGHSKEEPFRSAL